jgi:glycine cleavage system aminomethyltransferase T
MPGKPASPTVKSLADKFRNEPSILGALKKAPTGTYQHPVPEAHTNWIDEQQAWWTSAILFDQSFHMTDLYITGPDTKRLLAETSINNYGDWRPMKAFQYVATGHDGNLIADSIGFCLPDGSANIVGKPPAANWLRYCAEAGGYDVEFAEDLRLLDGNGKRRTFRIQLQGPSAPKILEEANGGPLPETKPFGMCHFRIGGVPVTGLRHGMAGAPGMEFWGDFRHREEVFETLKRIGAGHGLLQGGRKSYLTASKESGWVGALLPAIFSTPEMAAYREWLPASSFEANMSIGGSYDAPAIEDYYLDPWALGYHRLIHWEHDFIGREALLARRDTPHKRKVWLKWRPQDVQRIMGSMLADGPTFKFLEWPYMDYGSCPYDRALVGGRDAGLSLYAFYSVNARSWLSMGLLDETVAEEGSEVSIVWGEPDGGASKPMLAPHEQTQITATVSRRFPRLVA